MKTKLQYRDHGTDEWFDYGEDNVEPSDFVDKMEVGKVYSYDYRVVEIDD